MDPNVHNSKIGAVGYRYELCEYSYAVILHQIFLAAPLFAFDPLTVSVVEAAAVEQINIIVTNGLVFGAGITRGVTVNSLTTGTGIVMAATGELHNYLYRTSGNFQSLKIIITKMTSNTLSTSSTKIN